MVAASVCTLAAIGAGARIGPYSVLEPGAEVAPGTDLPPHSVVGRPPGLIGPERPGDAARCGALALVPWS